MVLMNRATGKDIDDLEHLKQSIADLLTTPKGSRVYVRNYGCDLFYLIDRVVNKTTVSLMYGAIAEALDLWEPRLIVTKITMDMIAQGHITLSLDGIYVPDGKPIRLTGIELVFLTNRL